MNQHTRITSVLLAAAMTAGLFVQPGTLSGTAEAADASYPVQEFRMGISDTDRNINLHSDETGDYLSTQTQNGTAAEKWYLHYVSAGVYEIVSAQTGCIITNENGLAVMSPDTDGANQRWKIVPVEQDFEGYDLYYKIVSNADNGAALTFRDGSNSIGVESYTGAEAQKFRLDLNGLEGFAAVSKVDGKLKAGTIGGLLGETVIVKTAADLVSALDSTEPKTVVIGADIDLGSQDKTKQRIRDDKTIVGSFDSNTIYDSQLRNDDFYGADDRPSQNIVIRNVNWVARTLNNNGSGVILLQFTGYEICGWITTASAPPLVRIRTTRWASSCGSILRRQTGRMANTTATTRIISPPPITTSRTGTGPLPSALRIRIPPGCIPH